MRVVVVVVFPKSPLSISDFFPPSLVLGQKKKNSKEEEEEDKRQQKGPQLNVQARQMRGIGSAYNQCVQGREGRVTVGR